MEYLSDAPRRWYASSSQLKAYLAVLVLVAFSFIPPSHRPQVHTQIFRESLAN